jgi:hypothetical protein
MPSQDLKKALVDEFRAPFPMQIYTFWGHPLVMNESESTRINHGEDSLG